MGNTRLARRIVPTLMLIWLALGVQAAQASTGWTVASTQNPGSTSNVLYAVDCTTSSFCVAVGAQSSSGADQTLVEVSSDGSGSSWSTVTSPDPAGSNVSNDLYGVSCVSSSFCVGVGSQGSSAGATEPLVLTFNGTQWSNTALSTPPPGSSAWLNAVSCTSASFCVAVGSTVDSLGNYYTLVYGLNGTTWSVEPSPNPGSSGFNSLWGISCVGTSYCMAVGGELTSLAYQNLALESTDQGASWSVPANPPIEAGTSGGTTTNNDLVGVSCLSQATCVVTGFYDNSLNISEPLMETYGGNWTLSTVTDTGSSSDNYIPWSIGCESPNLCLVIGGYQQGSSQYGLVEQSTDQGSTWDQITTAANSAPGFLYGVSCVSGGFCVAVGGLGNSTYAQTYATASTCNTSSGNLSNQDLSGCNLTSSNLQGKNLKGGNLSSTNLSGSSLQGSNLMNADLSGANLSGANLSGTNLKGVNFTNAILDGASLSGANLNGAIWSNTICPDGTNSNSDGGTCVNNL